MNIGKIIGTAVATRKDETLLGCKLMITQPLTMDYKEIGEPVIAVDTVGAGIGEVVIYTKGTAARNAARKRESAIDMAIVGIVDNIDLYD
ncbi:EutN/CcmL family microcompartment protein [Isachenkonia alkalipeptolytica]|uniref:Ethanolamine utilization protein EutN n=1 Tax=Isachenkonia alkalipeptolytica TaxID=2565777 RepID=A0AA44BDY7_9CLOT|nr:EutN/CcmL family microcompartment protein [Isachenkonia alkalipeptolytica]NBG88799.1 ethanolamine utilization protein EutN [Isachenkonia alkalipeptolytica]